MNKSYIISFRGLIRTVRLATQNPASPGLLGWSNPWYYNTAFNVTMREASKKLADLNLK